MADEAKPGVKTTEFWLVLIAIVLTQVTAQGLISEGSVWAKVVAATLGTLAALGYVASRTIVKKNGG